MQLPRHTLSKLWPSMPQSYLWELHHQPFIKDTNSSLRNSLCCKGAGGSSTAVKTGCRQTMCPMVEMEPKVTTSASSAQRLDPLQDSVLSEMLGVPLLPSSFLLPPVAKPALPLVATAIKYEDEESFTHITHARKKSPPASHLLLTSCNWCGIPTSLSPSQGGAPES